MGEGFAEVASPEDADDEEEADESAGPEEDVKDFEEAVDAMGGFELFLGGFELVDGFAVGGDVEMGLLDECFQRLLGALEAFGFEPLSVDFERGVVAEH